MTNYVANRYDCVGFVLEKLGIVIPRDNLPLGWWRGEDFLIKNLIEKIKNKEISKKIDKIILNKDLLLPGDILFFRLQGKFTHHMGIMAEDGHYIHNLPGRGVTRDYLRKNTSFFRFGVRLWE
jgi:cell wall-associated NlpC family hydrolase